MDSFPHFSVHSHFPTSFTQKQPVKKFYTGVFSAVDKFLKHDCVKLNYSQLLWITHSTTTFFRKCRHPVENFFHPCVLFFHIEQLLVEKVLKNAKIDYAHSFKLSTFFR